MELLKTSLVELLNIQGESGCEGKVAKYVMQRLKQLHFSVDQDRYGNVLAERKFGEGPVLLLSAHMDTVASFAPDRRLIWENDIIRSSEGILGADDRAGIAILLEVIRRMDKLQLNGTLKVAFTREEEIGRVGSNEIAAPWLADVDMAVVADRRNRRDIITSCRWAEFCPEEIGMFWERMGERIGQSDWTTCQGGISDALTYAEHGIPSVNLSCGYRHEHTDDEELYWPSVTDTARLIAEGIEQWCGEKE